MRKIIYFLFVISCFIATTSCGIIKEPFNVSLSKLYNDPAAYNHKLIKISGVISHGFESFSLTDPNCPQRCGVWLEYGGTITSQTTYCCGVSSARERTEPLVIENISIPLVQDETFHKFDEMIQKQQEPDIHVKATVIGRFFAGKQIEYNGNVRWTGYGHFGCCSLLAIQQIVSIDQ